MKGVIQTEKTLTQAKALMPDEVLAAAIELAKANQGQPVGIVAARDGSLTIGVLAIFDLQRDDWFYDPVVIDAETVNRLQAA